jgi:hypothetical protein
VSPKRFSRTKPGEYMITASDSSQHGSLFKLAFLWMPSCQRLPPWAVRNLRERLPPISRSECIKASGRRNQLLGVRRGAPRYPGQFMHHFAVSKNPPY